MTKRQDSRFAQPEAALGARHMEVPSEKGKGRGYGVSSKAAAELKKLNAGHRGRVGDAKGYFSLSLLTFPYYIRSYAVSQLKLEGVGMTSKRTRDRLVQRLVDRGICDQHVLEVIGNTPRHLFLDEALAHRAYEDSSLPIGHGQTLSQPYVVARMTEILVGAGGHLRRVLEVGTGSGYQTAILAQMVENVWSVERIKPLQEKARQRLRDLKLHNVTLKHSDGGFGWPEEGPFDGILSAAAPRRIPQSLLQQLAPGGVLVIPVGGDEQHLHMVVRDEDDKFHTQVLEPVRFVPLLSGVTQ